MKILAIAPHTDDTELGCGGTLARFIEENHQVWSVSFSTADDLKLEQEFRDACQVMGIQNVKVFDFPKRNFWTNRQAILQHLIAMRERIKPDWVFVPSLKDIHQDHQVVSREAQRAFKTVNLLAYELPWNVPQFNAQQFIKLERRHIELKLNALSKYESQQNRHYFNEDVILSWATFRGSQIDVQYAEVFEIIRYVM